MAVPVYPDDETVLLTLSEQTPLVQIPTNETERLHSAQSYFQQGRQHSDPRAIGTAQRLLQSWQNKDNVPNAVLLLRAQIAQYQHHFAIARTDLHELLKRQPQSSEAWLSLAFIERIEGNYSTAQQACDAVAKSNTVAALLCQASVFNLQGKMSQAYQLLESLKHQNIATQQWQLTEMAVIKSRLGNLKKAQQHFQAALAIPQRDTYLLGAYADFLIANQQAQTALTLLKNETNDDGLLLRATLAAKKLNDPLAIQWQRVLQARFDTAVLRQENLHQREAAVFYLHIAEQPQKALALAQANWKIQKEPEDALILLQTAKALRQPQAAEPARSWAKKYGWTDILKVDKP